MVLQAIFVIRHGFRSNWSTDHKTGTTSAVVPSPTNIPSDPALSAYGVQQAAELAVIATTFEPPITRIYSSPFYRCLQTITPFAANLGLPIICDRGLGEWYGTARFTHPSAAPLKLLQTFFPTLTERSSIIPSSNGETITTLHNRLAYVLKSIISEIDRASTSEKPESIVICTHAAVMIAIGRVLTGDMPEQEGDADFKAFTCGVSKFVRRRVANEEESAGREVKGSEVPLVQWEGKGVGGGWICEVNGGTQHLANGGERDWHFGGDESFIDIVEETSDSSDQPPIWYEGGESDRKAAMRARYEKL